MNHEIKKTFLVKFEPKYQRVEVAELLDGSHFMTAGGIVLTTEELVLIQAVKTGENENRFRITEIVPRV